MKQVAGWFIIGLIIGVVAMGLVFFGAFIERQNADQPSSMSVSENLTDSSSTGTGSDSIRQRQLESSEYADTREVIDNLNNNLQLGRSNAITMAIDKASPAVVGITVIKVQYQTYSPWFSDPRLNQFFGLQPRRIPEKVQNLGSGFIISDDGYIITNEHVVHGAAEVVVTMTTGDQYEAEYIGKDYDCDLALLKIEEENLPYLAISPEDHIYVGEWAIAIGNPYGLFQINDKPSVSVGVISAVGRDWERKEDGRLYRGMIQTDAAINPGNSGGPLLNVLGEVIGVNTFIYSPGQRTGSVGIGFAIPAKKLRMAVEQLKLREGWESDFWTGLEVQNLDYWISQSLGFRGTEGVIITNVDPGSPAEKAGIMTTDILFEIEGTRMSNLSVARDYFDNHDFRVGDELEMRIFRNGKEQKIILRLEARPK